METNLSNNVAKKVAETALAKRGASEVVIVGAACRLPGAPTLDAYWQNLLAGKNCASRAVRWPEVAEQGFIGGFLPDVSQFDASFFRISPNEARCMDPQQRLLLETVHHAIEHAGVPLATLQQLQCGVFCTSLPGDYKFLLAKEPALAFSTQSFSGNASSSLSGRISYFYDLHGPSVTLDTACSSSLTALQIACLQLQSGACNAALVGAASVFATSELFAFSQRSNMLSQQGRCAAFGSSADGFVPAEGVAAVLLMPRQQAEALGLEIWGTIAAIDLNHDGQSNGLMAPNGKAQGDLIAASYARAGISVDKIGYVETHGTGTKLGDPIEMAGLVRAWRAQGTDYSAYLGACKSVIGHSLVASGLASLLKTMLVLREGVIPPHPIKDSLNPELVLDHFHLNAAAQPWPAGKDYAAISAFGFTGSNAHMVLRQTVATDKPDLAGEGPWPFCISAQSAPSLHAKVAQLAAMVQQQPALALGALSVALGKGSETYRLRLALVAQDSAELLAQLQQCLAMPAQALAANAAQALASAALQRLPQPLAADLQQWLQGANLPLYAPHIVAGTRRIALPPYPFDTQSYWVGQAPVLQPALLAEQPEQVAAGSVPVPAVLAEAPPARSLAQQGQTELVAAILAQLRDKLAQLLGFELAQIDPKLSLRDFGVDSISVIQLLAQFGAAGAGWQPHDIFEFPSLQVFAEELAKRADAAASQASALPVAADSRLVQWQDCASGSNRQPILLLPPLNMSVQAWTQQIAFLRQQGFAPRVAIYPGHAGNACNTIGLQPLVADIIAYMQQEFDGTPVPVLGWSLGGCFALEIARQAPQLLAAMVLISTAASFQDDIFGKTIDLNGELEAHADYLSIVLEPKRSVVEQVSAGANMDVLSRYYRLLEHFNCNAALPHLPVRSLLVHGQRDVVIGAKDLALLRQIPGAQVAQFEDQGHFVPLTAAPRFNRLVLQFMRANGAEKVAA